MSNFIYSGIFKKLLISAFAVAAVGSAYADQFEFTSFYNGTSTTPGVDVILDTTSFDSVLNGWTIIGVEANPNNYSLMATGPVSGRTTNTNFIANTANGPSITSSSGTLFLMENPGPTQNMWEFFQTFPAASSYLIGPAGGYHSSAISVASVPEPSSLALLVIGMGAMGLVARRRKSAPQ
jgi:hypothetical protein